MNIHLEMVVICNDIPVVFGEHRTRKVSPKHVYCILHTLCTSMLRYVRHLRQTLADYTSNGGNM